MPIGEQGQEVSPADSGLVIHGLKHARLGHPDSGDEQQQPQHPADDKGRAPIKGGGHQVGQDGPGNTHRGDQHGAVAPDAFVQNLGNQGDARAQFSGQADAGDEPKRCIGRERGGHAVGQVGQGIEKDRGEHDRQPPLAIPEDTPENSADQHPRHLHVEKKHAVADQLLARKPQGLEARHPDDAEEHQIVDVHEIAQGGDNDRQAEDLAEGCVGLWFHGGVPLQEGEQKRV